MEKSEFTDRLYKHFRLMLSTAEKGAESEIVGRKSRSDATSFLEWLKTEHEKAASDTSLLTYDRFFSESMDTPEGAAANLTNIINFDLEGVVNWQEQFEFAFPILSNLNLEKSESWKFRGFFLAYIRGSKADARAKVFARSIENVKQQEEIKIFPAFAVLFVNDDAAHKALKAAMTAGIIDEAGGKKLGNRNIIPVIVQFWEAISDRKYELTHIRAEREAVAETYQQPCEAIAKQFGATISKSAIYDNAGKRAGKYFTAVARALGGT